jgi:hypothetical protein
MTIKFAVDLQCTTAGRIYLKRYLPLAGDDALKCSFTSIYMAPLAMSCSMVE